MKPTTLRDSSGAVLVAGAINTDLVARLRLAPEAGETVTGTGFAIFGGGKGANQATAAARAGAPTAILGALGDDDFGRQRRSDLEAEGINIASVATVSDTASGVALITVEESTGQNRIAYVPGATLTVTPEQATAAIARVRPAVLLTTLELPRATLTVLYAEARLIGAIILFNATPEAATGRELLARTDFLIVNESEAADLLEQEVRPQDAKAAALSLLDLGPRAAVITLGKHGAVIADGKSVTHIAAPEVKVVDTTGAGDAFCGAMAAGLAAGLDPVEAARIGVITGSLAATRHGAQPSIPTRAEVNAMRRGR
ncbi:MAG: ribokinase [Chloroflexota bacterium]|nr:ribokinase [Chloroflexota bacterium]